MSEDLRELRVGEAEGGRRLDIFLAESLGLSRAQVRRLLVRGAVQIDGRAVGEAAKGRSVPSGARVHVAPFRQPGTERPRPEPAQPLPLLAEGPGWVALDKPAGMPVHPLREEEEGTLLSALAARHPEMVGVGEGGLRCGVVHRLDVDTSGVMLFATQEATWQRLRRAFEERQVEKVYRALVAGCLDVEGGADLPLVVARHRPARVRVARKSEGSRGARLVEMRWRPLEVFAAATLVEVRPKTGFLHQIRAVLAHRGHPLLGDAAYGGADVAGAAPRHMLHASSIRFEEIAAESADSADFTACIERLRAGGA